MTAEKTKEKTIKDIADALGVSVTTVHKAIYNKKGISEKTRQKILDYIDSQDFHVNQTAAALKRKTIRLAILGNDPGGSSRYYYPYVYRGIDRCEEELVPFNVQIIKRFVDGYDQLAVSRALTELYEEEKDKLDGLLFVPAMESCTEEINKFVDAGIKVVTVTTDVQNCKRHSFVSGDNETSGRLMAEMMCGYSAPESGQVILFSGRRNYQNHYTKAKCFLDEMSTIAPQLDVIQLYEMPGGETVASRLEPYLSLLPNLYGICAVTARSTLAVCQILQAHGLSKKVIMIGADVFPELIPFFEDKTLCASVYQNPEEQGYEGLKNLYKLASGDNTVEEINTLRVSIVLNNNAKQFL